jgi:two-component system NarL family sensor kinase
LYPYVLEEVGLEGALRSVAQHAASRGSVKLTLELGYEQRHPQEQLLFSAARELLANVIEHAEATTVRVRLAGADDELALVVEDDGHGFNPERLAERLADGHVGLASQRVRIEAAGGSMNVASGPGRGTRVEIRVPNKH